MIALSPELLGVRNEMRFIRCVERGRGVLIERDHENQWDVWQTSSNYWDDAVEVETRR